METKLDRLFALLEGSNPAARKAAADQIGLIQKTHPYDLPILLERAHKYLYHKQWETRIAASQAIEAIAENVPVWDPPDSALQTTDPKKPMDVMKLASFDIVSVLSNGTLLLASGGSEFDSELDGMDPEKRIQIQRQQIREKLGMIANFGDVGIDDRDLLPSKMEKRKEPLKSDKAPAEPKGKPGAVDELDEKIKELEMQVNQPGVSARVKNSARRKLKELKKQQENKKRAGPALRMSSSKVEKRTKPATQVVTKQPQNDTKIVVESVLDKDKAFEDNTEWPFRFFTSVLLNDIFDPKWETRHGAAIGLRAILKKHSLGAGRLNFSKEPLNITPQDKPENGLQNLNNQTWLEDCAVKLLCVLALDRFADYISDNVIAPVKETVAQILGVVLSKMQTESVISILESLTHLQSHSKWEVRHSGFLGVKYLVAVRLDLVPIILPKQLPIIMNGLQDSEDDVRLVVADTLLPMVQATVQRQPENLASVLSILWNTLNDIDDLTASTTSIMKLLSEFYTQAAKFPSQTVSLAKFNSSLTQFIPRLYPFFRHSVLSVRISAITTLSKLLTNETQPPAWFYPLLCNCLRIIFQNIVLDTEPQVVSASYDLWCLIIQKIDPQELLVALTEHIPNFIKIVCTPIGQKLERNDMFHTHYMNEGEGKNVVALCDLEIANIRMQYEGARALGKLAFSFGVKYGHQNPFVQYARSLLSSNTATGRQVCAYFICETQQILEQQIPNHQLSHFFPEQIRDGIFALLFEPSKSFFIELLPSLQNLHEETAVLLQSFVNLGVPIQNLGIDLTQPFSPAFVQELLSHLYDKLKSLVPKNVLATSIIPQLDARRGRVANRLQYIEQTQNAYDLMVSAALSESFLAWRSLPSEYNNFLVDPLLRAVAKVEDIIPQRRAAKALAEFVGMCVGSRILGVASVTNPPLPEDNILNTIALLLYEMKIPLLPTLGDDGLKSGRKRKRKETAKAPSKKRKKDSDEEEEEDDDEELFEDLDKDEIIENIEPVNSSLENAEKELAARGGKLFLEELANLFGVNIFLKLPRLWCLFCESILKANENTPFTSITENLRLYHSLVPFLSPQLVAVITTLLPHIIPLVTHQNDQVREIAARSVAVSCKKFTTECIQIVIARLLPLLEIQERVECRLGAARAIHHIIIELEIDILPWMVFLMIPIMGRMSDSSREVRVAITYSFATLIKLMPLEAGAPDPPGMAADLVELKKKERHFLEQLLDGSKLDNYDLPIKINTTLRRYQQEGVNWLAFLNKYNLHGILCDDMGLGKTLQSLCIVASDFIKCKERHAQTKNPLDCPLPSLVVCPSILVTHWCDEVQKFCDSSVIPLQYHGVPTVRAALREKFPSVHIIVMSYEVLRNDIDILEHMSWNYCVLDEGHIIRNAKTKVTQAVKRVKARHRLILSGTPIQNNVLELWSLFDFLMPGFLGDQKLFNDTYSKPILQSRGAKASSREQELGVLALEGLHRQVLPFILRRVKEDVLQDLPPKIIQDYYCQLSPLQSRLYHNLSLDVDSSVKGKDQQHIFNLLQYLRKLCSHPRLVLTEKHPEYNSIISSLKQPLQSITHAPKLLALKQLLHECGIGQETPNPNPNQSSSQPAPQNASALNETLQTPVPANHRALIFCQTRSLLDIIEKDLFRTHMPSVTFFRMDGTTPSNKRPELCKRFNEDPTIDCFLLTTAVGGLGLNLTGADTVIFMEHDWNPMKDLQAMDRAHRIGTTRTVNVYRFITKGTLEEKIMGLQKFKLNIANSVVNKENQSFQSMDTTQLLELFNTSDTKDTHHEQTNTGIDELGNVTAGAPKGVKAILEGLDKLWDDSQYTEEYNLDNFLSSLKK